MHKLLKRVVEAIQKKLKMSVWATRTESSACDEKSETELERKYNSEFRETLVSLERKLHTTEDPSAITMEALKMVCAFHDADWAGILIVDRSAEMWSPAMWYDPELGEMGPTLFYEEEYFENFQRWVQALRTGKPIIVTDTTAADVPPDEAAQYERLAAHSVIGAPFGDRPTGFLVVRNPKRYPDKPDLVQMLAFVTLSSYYLLELENGIQMMREASEDNPADTDTVTINLFGVPEIITSTGQINEEIYHSENGWKLLTFLALKKTPVPSRSIATAIWPEENLDLKSDNIRHIIYRFKSKLTFLQPNELLVNTVSGYALNPDVKIICDIDEFDRLCSQAENTLDVQRTIAYLKKAISLYRGDIYSKCSHEHWLMASVTHYQMKYLNILSQLMSLLSEVKDYQAIQEVALQAMRIMPGNVNACYWTTISLYQLGGKDAAQKVIESIKPKLTDEEYAELKEKLKEKIK